VSISAASVKAIHAACSRASVDDPAYRAILRQVGEAHGFRVTSCKQLDQEWVGEVLEQIGAEATQTDGWTQAQLGRVTRYRRLAGMTAAQVDILVREVSGWLSVRGPQLTERDFDRLMQLLEERAEAHLKARGKPWPKGMQPRYWRTRNAGCSTRLTKKLRDLWTALQPHLPEESRTDGYLAGIVTQATGYPCRTPWGLQVFQVLPTIEALKDRLKYAEEGGTHPNV